MLPGPDTAGMKLELPSALNRFVAEMVDSGLYESESDVVREGLRLLSSQRALRNDVEGEYPAYWRAVAAHFNST